MPIKIEALVFGRYYQIDGRTFDIADTSVQTLYVQTL